MTELEVLNQMLGTLGEAPLQDADEEHSLLPAAKQRLANTILRVVARGWWFNREVVTLHPDPNSGFVYVPDDVAALDPDDTDSRLTMRGRRLYDPSNATYDIGESVIVRILRVLDFEDLPINAQLLVASSAVRAFNLDYDGDRTKLEEATQQERMANVILGAEEIRNVQANLLKRTSTATTMNRIVGRSGRLRTR